jgi:hypothetical protein
MAPTPRGPNIHVGQGAIPQRKRHGRRPHLKARKRRGPNPLLDPTTQLSGRSLSRAANYLTNLEFGGQQRQLRSSYDQATRQGTALAANASNYYRSLAKDVGKSVARQRAIGSELDTRLKTDAAGAQTDLSKITQEASQRASQDAALRGTGLSGGGQDRVAAEVAAARGLAAASAQSTQEQAALQSSNWANLQNITGQATTLGGGETRRDILNAMTAQQGDIRGQQNQLSGQVAQKRVANLLQLRQQGYENLVTARGLGIDMAKIRASERASRRSAGLARDRIKSAERQNAARLRVQRRGQDKTAFTQRRGQDLVSREKGLDRHSREKIAAGRRSMKHVKNEPADSRKARREIGNILSEIETNNWYRGRPKGRVLQRLRNPKHGGATPLGAEAAYQLHVRGWLGPELERRLRAAGIRIPKAWKHPGGPYGSGIPHNKV